MERKLLDDLKDGDPVAVALRGGVGWLRGRVAWRREGVMLLETEPAEVGSETPFVLVLTAEVSAIAVPRRVEPPNGGGRSPGFNR